MGHRLEQCTLSIHTKLHLLAFFKYAWCYPRSIVQGAAPLTGNSGCLKVPDKVAIVMGREADGVSKEMLDAADR
jgi:hypothetical protein